MLDTKDLRQLTSLVARSQRILVVSHANCGDATGAVTACYQVLTSLGKQVTVFLPAPVAKNLQFLPTSEKVQSDPAKINWQDYDLFLCVDAGEPKLTGLLERWHERPASLTTVNFDHHLTNPDYGEINIVERTAAATCVMLYEFFVAAGYPIDRHVATCLLTGIFTDTGTFSNAATNEEALVAASDLLRLGASQTKVMKQVVRNKELNKLKLWGRAFERLHAHPTLGIVSTIITLQDTLELGVGNDSVEGVANFLNDLAGYKAILVLREAPGGKLKGSLRTTREDVDVAKLAKLFGGGGHRKAAGFTISGRVVETDKGWVVDKVAS